jgi:ankyrin repeat protein
MKATDGALKTLVRAIVTGDEDIVSRLLASSDSLASARVEEGATRQDAEAYFLDEISHYMYAGDTALHIAAAGYRLSIVRQLIALGAGVGASNRRGARPLHYAADGVPGSTTWNPDDQAATITYLIEAGADPNAADKGGATPLHRAIRNRCAAAVNALLEGGADAKRTNKSGSSPTQLATWTTGRGGSGSAEARTQQEEIVRLLRRYGAG